MELAAGRHMHFSFWKILNGRTAEMQVRSNRVRAAFSDKWLVLKGSQAVLFRHV